MPRRIPMMIFGVVTIWLAAAAAMHLTGVPQPGWVAGLDAFVTADAFLLAAAFRVVHWRTTGDLGLLGQAAGFAGAAVVLPASMLIAPWGMNGADYSATAAVIRALMLMVIFPLLAARRLDNRAAAVRGAANATVVASILIAVASTAPTPAVYFVTECLVMIGWLVLADRALARENWFAVAMALFATGEATRLSGYALPDLFGGLAWGFNVGGALLLAAVALVELRDEMHKERVQAQALAQDLASARELLTTSTRAQRERMHDARSTVAGVIGAAEILARAPDPELQELMVAELNRLVAVLDDERAEPITEFDLRDALRPVVQMHKLTCPDLAFDVETVRTIGRVRTTATALDNLLRNARVHARGAGLRISTRVRAGEVDVVVDDDGPGIPQAEQTAVLGFGCRGSRPAGTGTGLGLHSAAVAMRDQSGALKVGDSPTGGTRVTISLPSADAPRTDA